MEVLSRSVWNIVNRVVCMSLPHKNSFLSPASLPAFLASLLCMVSMVGGQVLEKSHPEVVGVSVDRLKRLDEVIQASIVEEETPGAVVLVARQGRVIYRKAFGYRSKEEELAEPLTIDSIFDLASLTKVVATATSIVILVEEGKLTLGDPVADHIPEFGRRGKSKVTIGHLITHYSGLRPILDLTPDWEGHDKAIQLACRERLVRPPGKSFVYSDINYILLGEIVHRVSGIPLEEFAVNRIFEPLGMSDTGFNPGEEKVSRLVPTEKKSNGELRRGEVHDPRAFRMGGVAGHAGLFSTVDDVSVWVQMLLNGGVYNGVRILSPLGVLKMTTPQSPKGEDDWRGLGFDIDTRYSSNRGDLFPVGSFGHTGFTGTSIWIDPFTETFVILFTSRLYPDGQGDVVMLRRKVASVVASSIVDIDLSRELYYLRY